MIVVKFELFWNLKTKKDLPENVIYGEEELVRLLRSGSRQAFSYLYDNYAGALNGVIYRMVEDRELAEDILQDAFIKIWKGIKSYDHQKGRLFTWMLNICRNLTIDTLRSKGYAKQTKILGDENTVNHLANQQTEPDNFDNKGLRKQVANLKPEQRNIIEMAYFYGYTQEQIAKEADIPLGTVKTRMRSALMELRKHLQQE